MKALTADELRGVWAAIPTPWSADYRFDAELLEENVRRYEARGVHGACTTDSDGEFYAIELASFASRLRRLGHNNGIIGKARAVLGGFIADPGHTRPPYYPVDRAFLEDLRRGFEQYWSAEERAL